jgi:hypothetical protein
MISSNVTGVTAVKAKTYLAPYKYNVCVCVCVCVCTYSIYIFKKSSYTRYTSYKSMTAKVSKNGGVVTTRYNPLQNKKR